MSAFANDLTVKVFKAVADAVDGKGGTFMGTLPDGRTMTVVVLHDDPKPAPGGTP